MLLRLDSSIDDSQLPELIRKLRDVLGEELAVVRTSRERGLSLPGLGGAASVNTHLADLALPAVTPIETPAGRPYVLSSREFQPEDSHVTVRDVVFGGSAIGLIAGPCSVESHDQLRRVAEDLRESGVRLMRAGAFKPRTSPWAFQGLGARGLEILREVADEFEMGVVTEVMAPDDVELVAAHADMLQIGSRNAQNFPLLRAVGQSVTPVLLKRGMMSTIDELLGAADYVLAEGNPNVVLCERGIRGFDAATRNVLDVVAVPLLHERSHLPVIIDPSHGCGRAALVPAAAKAGLAAGADGLLIEVHPEPRLAFSDADQALDLATWRGLLPELQAVARAVGRDA